MPAISFTTGASTALLLLTAVTVGTTLFMLHGDSMKPWSSSGETTKHSSKSHHALLRLHNEEVITTKKESLVEESQGRRTQEKNPQEIRYVAFGTSSTWGAGVDGINRETDVYPKLLSPNAVNLAIRASGPGAPAMCIKTMLESAGPDAIYDVIMIEYYHRMLLEVDIDALYTALQRLRKRFPDALIVFIRDWYIVGMIGYVDNVKRGWVDTEEWNKKYGKESPIHSDAYANKFLQSVQNGFEWTWNPHVKGRDSVLAQMASSVNGKVISLTRPENAVDFLDYRKYLAPDGHHLSLEGHKDIARRVAHVVNTVGIHPNPRLGSWDDAGHDVCISWFDTGECPLKFQGKGVEMDNWFAGKYGLTFPFPTGGDIFFANPINRPMDLYINFMANGPLPSYYPLTEITVESLSAEKGVMQLKPVYIDPGEPYKVHIIKPAFIGTVPPGDYILHARPVEAGKEHPFRIVGINLSDPRQRFETPEVHSVQPDDCVDVQHMMGPPVTLSRGQQLTLSHYTDPKTTELKNNRSPDHAKVVAYVCDNVFGK